MSEDTAVTAPERPATVKNNTRRDISALLGSPAGRNTGLVVALILLCLAGVVTAGDRFADLDNVLQFERWFPQAFAGTNVRTPVEQADATHVHHLYVVRVAQRAAMEQALKERGIATAVYYPRPLHRTKLFRAGVAGRAFPNSDALSEELLAIPLYPEMSDEQQNTVVAAVRAAALAVT